MKFATKLALNLIALLLLLAALAGISASHGQGATPAVTPDTKCGARGIGRDPRTFEVVELERAGLRVGADGTWTDCDRPCTNLPSRREWVVAGNVCVATDDPLAGKVLLHGQSGYWQQWQGAMRGQLIERCTDGARSVVGATCAPATHCDVRVAFERAGVAYAYDARPDGAKVPLGATVDALSDDGRRWPISCVAGNFVVPEVLPAAPAPVASAPAKPRVLWCGPQVVRSKLAPSLVLTYAGPRLLPGAEANAYSAAGDAVRVVCGADARLVPAWDLGR